MSAQPLHQTAGSPQAVPANGAGAQPAAASPADDRSALRNAPGMPAQLAAMAGTPAQLAAVAGMLAGLWVAISPWFLAI
jgi:hypothetical protein